MRRSQTFSLLFLACAVAAPIAGCGGDSTVTEGTMSPEMKKADDAGRSAMEEFMKSKKQQKKKAGKAAGASGAAPIPGGAGSGP